MTANYNTETERAVSEEILPK